ncbi:MAG: biopolymer transporter ExbD [Verrucomicrobiales bacterium]|jgi:biopolymer transport protein ExbD|nr:biopolymer transporter ExbD [Verrucomicrobiales bacterium]
MNFNRNRKRRAPTVIIVSLIDVLLVVLIFLMVTTTFKKDLPPELRLALPESKQAKAGTTDSKPLVITVATNAPYFFLEDKPVTFERVQTALVQAAKKDPQVKVAIKADKRSPWGEVIKVIDAAKSANVGAISAITEKPAGP